MKASPPEVSAKESHDYLGYLIDGIAEPVIVEGDRSRFVFLNSAYGELHGRDCDELLRRTGSGFLPMGEANGTAETAEGRPVLMCLPAGEPRSRIWLHLALHVMPRVWHNPDTTAHWCAMMRQRYSRRSVSEPN
ncbi:hypothetical protein SO078_28385 (plasmid) [Sinorhizobium meliloti]|uniref:hypothetical protein n=1 Tax=Rhizobium meliloti TaxID=382 RepID=UPI002D79EDB2|nr:hypothetical protein [Sinorhizobium meliloti]WRQ71158.1 hypothetical protein SO078_28385 [Sinorhizobium meliloti]